MVTSAHAAARVTVRTPAGRLGILQYVPDAGGVKPHRKTGRRRSRARAVVLHENGGRSNWPPSELVVVER
jgi:hypothetical protein